MTTSQDWASVGSLTTAFSPAPTCWQTFMFIDNKNGVSATEVWPDDELTACYPRTQHIATEGPVWRSLFLPGPVLQAGQPPTSPRTTHSQPTAAPSPPSLPTSL